MNSDLFTCQFCKEQFSVEREPFLLPDCGHSVCADCLKQKLQLLKEFKCKEDGILVTKSQLQEFPKNFALLQVIKTKPKIQIKYAEDDDSSSNSEKHSTPLASKQQFSDSEQSERCPIHRKKLEILCIDDKVKICSSCALFGMHQNHKVLSVQDAIQQISKRVEDLFNLHKRVDNFAKEIFEQSQYYNAIESEYQNALQGSLHQIEAVFQELHQSLDNKKNQIIDETKQTLHKMEDRMYKQLQESMVDVSRKVDLWKMSSSNKINYFTEKTDKGEIALDLIAVQSTSELHQLGEQLIKELELCKGTLRIDDLNMKEMNLEFKGNFEQFLTSSLRLSQVQRRENSASRIQESITEYSLLKDINNSIILQDPLNQKQMEQYLLQYQDIQRQKMEKVLELEQQQQILDAQSTNQYIGSQIGTQLSKSSSSSNLRKVSPSPIRRSTKSKKINDKFQPILTKMKFDSVEQADFTQAELGDEGLLSIITLIIKTKNLKSIKLAKNKLQDPSVIQFLTELIDKQNDSSTENNQISTINLSSNMITERIVDSLLDLCKKHSRSLQFQELKQIYLNQNIINASKVKKKIEEIKKYGLVVYI